MFFSCFGDWLVYGVVSMEVFFWFFVVMRRSFKLVFVLNKSLEGLDDIEVVVIVLLYVRDVSKKMIMRLVGWVECMCFMYVSGIIDRVVVKVVIEDIRW